jgi:hypothetical protein
VHRQKRLAVVDMKGHIRGSVHEVGEVVVDLASLVARADQEITETVMVIVLHDMPKDRLAADFDHRFRAVLGFFRKPRAQATCKDHDLQDRLRW